MAKMNKRQRNRAQSEESEIEFTTPVEMTVDDEVVESMLEDILQEDDYTTVEQIFIQEDEHTVDDPVTDVELSTVTELDVLLIELQDSMHPDELQHYSISALKKFRDTGVKQSRTPRGNYPCTRTRPSDLDLWSADELMDWLEGRIKPRTSVSDEDIYGEIYIRWCIPTNYTFEDARKFVLEFTLPARSPGGELVNDRRRESCKLEDMTFAMLCSICLGEVNTKHSSEDAYKRLKTNLRAASDEDVNIALEQYKNGRPLMTNKIEQILYTLDDRKKMFKQYGADLTDRTVADNQIIFYNHLRRIMKLEYAEFAESWRSLLRYVDNNYQELFVATRARRGWTLLDISAGNLATFDRLITLITGTRNGATRHQDVKHLKMDYILEFVLNSKERDNLLAFYQS